MKKRVNIFFLLISFLGVQLISFTCTLTNLSHLVSHAVSEHESHHHHSNDSSDCNQENTDSNCCNEESSFLIQGVKDTPNKITKRLTVNQQSVHYYEKTNSLFKRNYKKIRKVSIHPPPTILESSFYFKILFQSFQL
jgi:hypothetical protein